MMDRVQTGSCEPSQEQKRRILLVDDNAEGREALGRYLELQGFEIWSTPSGVEAAQALRAEPRFDIVVTDLVLPDLDGREIARLAKQCAPAPLVVLMTGWAVDSNTADLARDGIDLLFFKPLDLRELIRRINEAMADRHDD